MGKFLNKLFKTLTMTICCSLIAVGCCFVLYKMTLGIYHDSQTHTIAQYGPKTTQSGNTVTIILKESGLLDSYRLSALIVHADGSSYERDIYTDRGYRSRDDMLNDFVTLVDNTRGGAYENV